MVNKKKNLLIMLEWIEKSVPRITIRHHSASLMMPKGGHQDGFFYPTLTHDSLILCATVISRMITST